MGREIARAASTAQDDTSATCAEDLFKKCVRCRARGRRCAYLIVWSEAAAGHATADDHGFDLANNSGIAAPGARNPTSVLSSKQQCEWAARTFEALVEA